jgi:ankyrin repeat protein
LTIRAVQTYAPSHRAAEMAGRIARARAWLAATTPRSAEDRAMKLLGLAWADTSAHEIRAARIAVLREQRADGGWGQYPGAVSDAYSTGQALVALNQAGGLPVIDRQYRRGVAFLLRTQRSDGSWRVVSRRTHSAGLPFFETGYPHAEHQFISYAGAAWAVMTIALTRGGSRTAALMAGRLQPGGESTAASTDPMTPLMHAAFDGSLHDLERELQSANVNVSTHSGLTALMWAAHDPDKVGRLLAAGANPKLTARSGHSPLLIAAGYDGASRSVQALLDAGADVDAVTTQGQITPFTALVRAAMRGDTAMVRSLHARGARTVAGESSLRMPVLMAAVQGDTAMVALLLELGAPIDARYPKEYEEAEPTLLMQAIAEGHPDAVKLLLSRGASVHLGDSRGWTPLMYAAAGIDRGDTRSLEAVLQARPDLSAITPQGETAHALAVRYGNYTAAALLRRASDQGRARDADVGAENRSAAPL